MKSTRREFLTRAGWSGLGLGLAGFGAGCATPQPTEELLAVMTVTGPVPASELGLTLPHEHVLVDFIGAEEVSRDRYDFEDAFETVLPHLLRFRALGGRSIAECTPAFIGRDVELLRALSEASGVYILTNTGYYGAVGNKYLPPFARRESADQIAERWLFEWSAGVENTGIRPGFVKLGVDPGKLSDVHETLVRAGARVHLKTGLTAAVHTGDAEAALDQMRVLHEEGVAPDAWIWVHAQNGSGPAQVQVAQAGGWVSLDGISPRNLDRYEAALLNLRRHGLLHRVLISHDDGWAVQGKQPGENLVLFGNGNEEPYSTIFDQLLPQLRQTGFSDADLLRLLVVNPREALAIRVRALTS